MNKGLILGMVVVAGLGVTAGALAVYTLANPEMLETQTELREARHKIANLEAQLPAMVELEEKVTAQAAEAQRLQDELASMREQDLPREPRRGDRPRPEGAPSEAPGLDTLLGAVVDEIEDPDAPEERTEEEQERAERRREWANQMRTNIQDYLYTEMEATKDPVAADRLQAMAEYTDYLFDLRRQIRDAETDEEREQLFDAMRTAGEEARGLVEAQQQDILADIAADYGLNADQGRELATRIDQTMEENPFFRMGRFGGGFGGGPSGGWGDRGRGGGDRDGRRGGPSRR